MAIPSKDMDRLVQCSRIVDRVCRRLTHQCSDAEDLRQDVYLKICSNAAPFATVPPEALPGFLGTTVKRLHIDHHRRRSETLLEEPKQADALLQHRPEPEEELDVRRGWARLSERDRATLLTTEGEDCGAAAHYQRRARAKRRLCAVAGISPLRKGKKAKWGRHRIGRQTKSRPPVKS